MAPVWELRGNVTAYDAVYVGLAEALGAALVTADASLASAPDVRCSLALVEIGGRVSFVVELRGLEPLTFRLPAERSPS